MDCQQKQSPAFSESSDSKVSRKYIHNDLAFYVLSKLPIKSLKRFGCVRKSWSSLFDDSHFLTVFRNHFISRHNSDDDHHTFLLIYQRDHADREYAEFHLLDSRIKLNLPPPFSEEDRFLSILGKTSVNGIFCIGQDSIGGNKVRYVLWNPATEEFVNIPPSPDELVPKHPLLFVFHKFHGFGYDQLRDDFKVIQYVSFDSSGCDGYDIDSPPPQGIIYYSFFEIYSLRNNSWKILHIDDMSLRCVSNAFTGEELYMNGACHWLVQGKIHDTIALMSFDLSHEVFLTTPIDERSELDYGHLAVLNGSIAFIINHDKNNTFHISILGELGVKESWIKLFILGPMPSIDWPLIGFGNKGYIFFRKIDDELVRVDLSTQIIEELGVKGEDYCCKIGIYKESLLSIRGSTN
ncbi:F-box/kelch-repeat protein At3g06240-like [Vicia villosa]|uniref:F-box/kelch-repeat protein At3g06240-like n=1 Tax=Vicia villosa TaxID=3911 RepID=UPI00273B2310|nr:F-box/kelch-repeat protein At3g06240-like [Vicia villosa]